MNRVPVILLAALFAACGGGSSYVKVRKVKIEGNQAVSDEPILAGLVTRKPAGLLVKDYAEYDEVSVARDRERIEAFYRSVGFFAADVQKVDVKKPAKDQADVTFFVNEGEPTKVASVDILNYPERLPKNLPLPTANQVYKQENYVLTKQILADQLVEKGYAHATVGGAVAIDRDERTADVNIQADPGPLTRFGKLTLRGARRIPRSTLLARVDWKEGEMFSPEKVRFTQGRLYQLGMFASVNVRVDHDDRLADAPMVIRVREAQRHELKLGVGAAIDDANILVRPRIGYTIRPLFDPLLTLDFDARPGVIVRGQGEAGNLAGSVAATAERHDLFKPLLRGTFGLTAEVVELETYSSRGGDARVTFDHPFFRDRLLVGVGYRYRIMDFARVSQALSEADREDAGIPTDIEGFALEYKLGTFEQSLSFDHRDKPLDAHNGFYAELRLEEAGPYSASSFTYFKLTPEFRGYVSPWHRLVFAAKARYGTAFGSRLPITQRYFSGGASSHRGFTFRRLAPMSSGMTEDMEIVPIGGNRQLETSFETRLDIFKLWQNWFGVVAFVDGGDVTIDHIPDPLNLHWAAGLGLRYDTVVGPLRVDFGYRLNRFGDGEPDAGKRFAFHLSLGEAF